MASSTHTIAIPGQLLGPAAKYVPGAGTHIHEANLYASLLGVVHIAQPARAPGPSKRLNKITAPPPAELPTISISRSGISKKREVLPEVDNIVLCRVTRITPRQAVVAILVCGDTVLDAEWQGLIRVQDVRATEKDRVKIYESFRPGDIVRAKVVCLLAVLTFDSQVSPFCRFHLVTKPITTSRQQVMSWVLSWLLARAETRCIPLAGRSTRIQRPG